MVIWSHSGCEDEVLIRNLNGEVDEEQQTTTIEELGGYLGHCLERVNVKV